MGSRRRAPDMEASPQRSEDRKPSCTRDPALLFAIGVTLAGVAFAALLAAHGRFDVLGRPSAGLLLLAGLTAVSELHIVRLPSQRNDVLLSASSMFALTLALRYGPGAAVVALGLGTFLKDLRARRPAVKLAFNTSQLALAVGLAALLYEALGGNSHPRGADLPPALAAGAVFLALNYLLTSVVVGLATGTRVRIQLRHGLGAWLPVEGVVLAFAPVVAMASERTLWSLPLLILPFAAVEHSARIAMRSDHDAMHDALTGLPNRVLFRIRVGQAVERARHAGGQVIVMVLDLDGFKEVNDTLGHGRGDELLQGIAERLRHTLREADLVARLGGDEFGVLIVPGRDGLVTFDSLAERIRDSLSTPFQLGDLWVEAGTSIGIACSPEHAKDAETLVQRADVAMYLAKHSGAGHDVYDIDRDPNRPERLRLLQDLRGGTPRGELVLHSQPKVDVATGALAGVEALVRWQHPTRGLLPPGDFIELAEGTDVVRALTLRVLEDAIAQAARWQAVGRWIPVAVNLSARVLLDVTLTADIARLLDESGLPPRLLEVEITETALISDPERTAAVLSRISEAGVRIAIDDFGTGYSSLALLKRLPVDAIKIDRSFVSGIDHDPDDRAIVESTVRLAASLGLEAIAEGVETATAWQRLIDYGCPQAQGYHMCRPLEVAHLEAWLAERGGALV